jgi:hypothetical protein
VNAEQVMIVITYDRAIDEEVLDLLDGLTLREYTRWKDVTGAGRHDPHLGSDVWPGLNNILFVVTDVEKKEVLLEAVKGLQKNVSLVGLRAFVLPVLETV